MRLFFLFMALSLAFITPGLGQSGEYFQQDVHYTISVRLDTDEHMLTGASRIAYTNNSPDTLSQFYLHLYPNAYRGKESAFLKSHTRMYNYCLLDLPKSYRSWMEIDSLSVDGRRVELYVDDTLARFDLPRPLMPGGSMILDLSFREKIRRHFGRAGYRGEQYDIAQWYPKVVVYDEKGFHPDKFELGEFYGEFGTYDVSLEIPENYVVCATGLVQDGDPGWELNAPPGEKGGEDTKAADPDAYKTVRFLAERVHDFAWVTSPSFAVQDTIVDGITVMSVFNKNDRTWADSTLTHGLRALNWLNEKVGPYPYPQLTIVHCLMGGGGMEYPMLAMDGRVSEGLVFHEVGHIYFYGALANDEREEAWLDEGLTSFQTNWYQRETYGPYGRTDEWNWYQRITPQYTLLEKARRYLLYLLRNDYGERVATRPEKFENSYHQMVYVKSALFFNALRYYVGPETFESILKAYYEKWKFKHVNEDRLRAVCEDVSGQDLRSFFEEWLHSRKNCDYRLEEMKATQTGEGGYRADVHIKRIGELIMPLSLEFTLADNSRRTFRLGGRLRTIKESFDLPAKPRKAALNPDNDILDINLSDNFLPRDRDFQFDWPNNYYYPERSYQIRWRPGFWYNDIDGFKSGLALRSSYLNDSSRRRLAIYYGAESERVDFDIRLDKKLTLFGNRGRIYLSGYKMEGRIDGNLSLFLRRRDSLIRPPSHDLVIGFNFHELRRREYLVQPEHYESKADLGPYVVYTVDPQYDLFSTRLQTKLKLGRDWWAGEYDYERFYADANLKTRTMFIPVQLRLRLFLGLIGGQMPLQQKFFLAGGSPLMRESRFFLRSPGAVWEDMNYHPPGHGNLRGYLAGDFGVNRLLAMNSELHVPLPLGFVSRLTFGLLGSISGTGFVDVGNIMDKQNPNSNSYRIQQLTDDGILGDTLVDAGLGLKTRLKLPFFETGLRLDFPFYVNHPEVNGETEKVRYRYAFSLEGTF